MTDVDWTTQDGCPRCDEHGPFLPYVGSGEATRDIHQAWHGFAAAMIEGARLVQVVEWLNRRLTRHP